MANLVPLFTTAPRIRLRIFDQDVAYAIGLNINVSVDLQPVQVIGQFGPVSIEPTMYNLVTGTMQIIRLISGTGQALQKAAADNLIANGPTSRIHSNSNSVVSVTRDPNNGAVTYSGGAGVSTNLENVFDSNNPLSQNQLHRHMNPRTVLFSRTFDLDLDMIFPKATADLNGVIANPTHPRAEDSSLDRHSWLRVVDCRITSRNINFQMGQLVNEPISFQGLLATPVVDHVMQFGADPGVNQG